MFAIELREENLDKIEQAPDISSIDMDFVMKVYKENKYIFIRNYVTKKGTFIGCTFLPRYIFDQVFDYDPEKIQHDWDQIVRIPSS